MFSIKNYKKYFIQKLTIKVKLILIFILIKIIPLLFISYIAYNGAKSLNTYMKNSVEILFNESKTSILDTANESINDSIENLDKKSQLSLERVSYEVANNIAAFLYQRDEDILFLSKLDINQELLEKFYATKNRDIITHEKYFYDDKTDTWKSNQKREKPSKIKKEVHLKDNARKFHLTEPNKFDIKKIPLYKEINFFDLKGKEKYKVSQINPILLDISKKKNTYINSETYYKELVTLKKGEVYVSNIIGEYVKSKIIGTFTKEKAKKAGIKFEPEKYAYAGKENPNGKRFQAIIRFVTPVFKDNIKIGYLSLALDHEHLMQFTDTLNPIGSNARQDIADASIGNYAFMWDNLGRNISHVREYFIVGYDKNTGKAVMPWLSEDLAKKYEKSNKEINDFLSTYPSFHEQSLSKKPNLKQIEDGNLGIDCRYLNFAPQCQGWMQLTKNGGYGSFIIYWSNVWKLSTAATIPYYTGQYKNSKRGFGFVTIGANVDEFHAAANETRESVKIILQTQTKNMKKIANNNEIQIQNFIENLINELTIITLLMVILVIIIALWLSNYISKKIENLLIGTKKFANNELDYRIKVSSYDEIGELESSFNNMASKINNLIKEEKKLNETLEFRVRKEITKQREQEQLLIQQSKLAAMGEMIGNIAHQWRQPLNTLSLIIQNIQFTYENGKLDDDFFNKSTKKVKNLTLSMSKTIDDFRYFFKPNRCKEVFALTSSIKKSIELVNAALIHNQINLKLDFAEKAIFLYGYSNEFSQALLNILTNAKDALLEKDISEKQIYIQTNIKDKYCKIEIFNNGNRIDEKIVEKIFEPYFTTKIDSQGTGIGLYMTKTIIEKNMNGKISIKNRENGVSFIIKIPIYNKE